jgi:hypothetical protein
MLPSVEMILHHVAVDTSLRIVAQVTRAFAVTKGKQPNTNQCAKTDRKCHR